MKKPIFFLLVFVVVACRSNKPDPNGAIGHAHFEAGEWRKAASAFQQVIDATENADTMMCYKLELSDCYFHLDFLDSAHSVLLEADSIQKKHPNEKYEAEIVNEIGHYFSKKGLLNQCKDKYEEALDLYKNWKLPKDNVYLNDYASACNNYSFILGQIGIHADKGLEYSQKAVELFKQTGNNKEYLNSLNTVGFCYRNLNRYDTALVYYNKCISESYRLKDSSQIAASIGNIGALYSYQGMSEKAIEYFHQGAYWDSIKGSTSDLIVDYSNIGATYIELKEFDLGLEYINRAITLAEQIGDIEQQAFAAVNLGRLLTNAGDFEMAAKAMARADTLVAMVGSKSLMITLIINYGNNRERQKLYPEAEKFFRMAIDSAKRYKIPEKRWTAQNNLGINLYRQEKYQEAFKEYNIARNLLDTLQDQSKEDQIVQLQSSYESELKNNQLLESDRKKKEAELTSSQRKNALYIAGIVLLMLLSWAVMLIWARKRNLLLIKQLGQKNEEVGGLNQQLNETNGLLLNEKKEVEDLNNNLTNTIFELEGEKRKRRHFQTKLNQSLNKITSGSIFAWVRSDDGVQMVLKRSGSGKKHTFHLRDVVYIENIVGTNQSYFYTTFGSVYTKNFRVSFLDKLEADKNEFTLDIYEAGFRRVNESMAVNLLHVVALSPQKVKLHLSGILTRNDAVSNLKTEIDVSLSEDIWGSLKQDWEELYYD